MNRIDFLGVAGSGKTSIVNHVQTGGSIASMSSATKIAANRAFEVYKGNRWKHRALYRLPLLRKLVRAKLIEAGEAQAFACFATQHDAFLAAVHDSFAVSARSQYRRAEGYYHFIRTIRRIAFLNQWLFRQTVLFDESLSQKVYAVMPSDRGSEAHAIQYFERMPLPAALIHLDADPDQVVRQVRKREISTGQLIPGHRGLSDIDLKSFTDSSLQIAQIGAECLHVRGCPVLSLVASEPPEVNAERVIGFIDAVVL